MHIGLQQPMRRLSTWLTLAGILLIPLMITTESLWLDEGDTAMYALQPDFHSWWRYLMHDGNADCQMPLSMLFAWITAKTIGCGEWHLRAINLLWGALAVLGLHRVGRRLSIPWLGLLIGIQPYLWFYANEARPYALQIAGGAWLLAGLVEFLLKKGEGESWAWIFAGASVLLCYSTMLAPLPIGVAIGVAGVLAWRNGFKIGRKPILILTGSVVAVVPLALYYLSTLLRGAKGAQLWQVDWKCLAYVMYELTGAAGLGPAVEQLRELAQHPSLHTLLAEFGAQFGLVAAFGFLLLLVFGLELRQKSRDPVQWGILLVPAIVCAIFFTIGLVLHKAFWARHLAPVFPFYVALLGCAIDSILKSRRLWLRAIPAALAALILYSSLNLRLNARHRKEDYRAAAQLAGEALRNNKSVWWLASPFVAHYYGLDCAYYEPVPGKVFFTGRDPEQTEKPMPKEKLQKVPLPDLIIFSKPDIYDTTGTVRSLMKQKPYQPIKYLKSFIIWSEPPHPQTL